MQVRTISKEQLEALRAPLGDDYKQNSRPVQSLKGRTIELYNEFTD
jgi:carbonic anhydrase